MGPKKEIKEQKLKSMQSTYHTLERPMLLCSWYLARKLWDVCLCVCCVALCCGLVFFCGCGGGRLMHAGSYPSMRMLQHTESPFSFAVRAWVHVRECGGSSFLLFFSIEWAVPSSFPPSLLIGASGSFPLFGFIISPIPGSSFSILRSSMQFQFSR